MSLVWRWLSRVTKSASAGPAGGRRARALQEAVLLGRQHGGAHEAVHLGHDGAAHLHGVVLLGLGAEVGHVVDRVVDAADEAQRAVHHHDLAVHAAQHVQALAEQAPAGIEHAQVHARLDQAGHEGLRQVRRAEAVHQQVHLRAPVRGLQQRGVQAAADLVVEEDEGLQHDLAPGLGDGLEDAREELLAVLQQPELIARHPAGGSARPHSAISAASGAWSDSRFQGRRGRASGACTAAPRT